MHTPLTDHEQPQVAGYRILRVIGHGGMSTVYLAEQQSLGRKVALKVMLPEALADEVSRSRFENEARTIARLQHPHIVGIHEVGRTADGVPFYSMPYLPRGHLAQRKWRGDQPRAAAVLRALLQALDHAHVRGVVHRDVKAENVLFDDTERPQLADFGIALRRGSSPRLTSAGLAVGSTAYMPPEQARGLEVDRRADLYSVGVLAWEMLTGQLPYNAGDALSMALMHTQDPIPRLPAPLRHWQGFIDRAMAKKPEERFASAREMLEALEALEQRAGRNFGTVALPAPDKSAPATATATTRWPVARSAALALGMVALVALALVYTRRPAEAPPMAAATPAAASAATAQAAAEGEAAPALPAPEAGATTGVLAALETPAGSEGSAYVANALQQIEAGALWAPANANAWDSWDAAWRTNPTHADVQQLTARLFDALALAGERALREGNAAAARLAFERARQLDARRGGDGSAIQMLRTRLATALGDGMAARVRQGDRNGAQALLTASAWLGLPAARRQALLATLPPARAEASTVAAAAVATAAPVPAELIAVSVAEYGRFVEDTGRAAADCGRGLVGPRRAWNTPARNGNDGAPVVCVSAADAQAYAAWLSAREKRRYRLPTAGEVRAQPATPVSGWLTLCGDAGCRTRMASGKPRPLQASRGHPDVGIRLVRER